MTVPDTHAALTADPLPVARGRAGFCGYGVTWPGCRLVRLTFRRKPDLSADGVVILRDRTGAHPVDSVTDVVVDQLPQRDCDGLGTAISRLARRAGPDGVDALPTPSICRLFALLGMNHYGLVTAMHAAAGQLPDAMVDRNQLFSLIVSHLANGEPRPGMRSIDAVVDLTGGSAEVLYDISGRYMKGCKKRRR